MKVYLAVFAGQSNMEGFGMGPETLPIKYAHTNFDYGATYIWGGQYWGQIQPGVNTFGGGNPQGWGPETSFAREFRIVHPDDILLIVKVTAGNTNQYGDWYPHGLMFNLTELAIKQALASATVKPDTIGLLWYQGEADAMHYDPAMGYTKYFNDFLNQVGLLWFGQDVPIVAARIHDTPLIPFNADIRVAQWQADQDRTDVITFKTKDISRVPDGIHHDALGYLEVGRRLFDNMEQLW